MNITYINDPLMLTAVVGDRTFSTPYTINEDNSINQVTTKINLQKQIALNFNDEQHLKFILDTKAFRDDVYMNGGLSKSDHSINSTSGEAIVKLLELDWPDEVSSYTTFDYNLTSEFFPNRLPYVNESISWYCFEEPTEGIKTTYNLSYPFYNPWYGLKFDKITKEVMAKIVIQEPALLAVYPNLLDAVDLPPFWEGIRFFARIHKKDGSVDPHFDVYANSPPELMQEWCDAKGLTFPYDITDTNIRDNLLIWGIVVNANTNEISYVKAYTRNYILV